MWESAVITNAGKTLLANWIAGTKLNFDAATTGEGTVAELVLMAQTALVSEKQTLSIIKMEEVDGGIRLQLQCTSEGITSSYTINQIGIWASLDGGDKTLVAIYQDATGVSVPTYEEMPDYVFTFYATLQMSNEGDISVTLDTSAFVTQEDLQAVDDKIKVLVYFNDDGYPCWKLAEDT